MKPDRILLAELRSEEAFDYLRNVNSGHPGSITSVHATSAELASRVAEPVLRRVSVPVPVPVSLFIRLGIAVLLFVPFPDR